MMPSNSIVRFLVSCGTVNDLRYQPIPGYGRYPPLNPTSSVNGPSMPQSWGRSRSLHPESSKSGVDADTAKKLIAEISSLENLRINGLMTMPPFFNEPAKVRPYFVSLRNLRDQIQSEIDPATAPNISMSELSMGMTGDFEVAIETGATLVRIGTAIFGERN